VVHRYLTVRTLALVAMDVLILTGITALAVWIRLGHPPAYTFSPEGYRWAVVLIVAVHLIVLYYHELYGMRGPSTVRALGVGVAQSVAVASMALFGLYYLVPELSIGRGIFLINMLLLPPILTLSRVIYLWVGRRETLLQRVAILGEADRVGDVAERISGSGDYLVVGCILPAGESHPEAADAAASPHSRCLGWADQLEELIPKYDLDCLVVAMRERRGRLPLQSLLSFKLMGLRIEEQSQFIERVTGRVPVAGLPPSSLVFSDGFKRIAFYQRLKFVPDIVMAGFLLVLLSPLLVAIGVLVRLDSPGKVLYRQVRVGRAGLPFKINKFRTMRKDAEALGATFATENDPRVTRLGGFLRRSRLDELPQLLNVVQGDMAFVGPRPERPEFVSDLQEKIPYYYLRTVVRPGITGWAQIRYPYGSTTKEHQEKLEHDLYYIKNISMTLDTIIAIDTVRVMLFAHGSR